MSELSELLRCSLEALDEARARYALMGGCARNAYAEPRATKDVDFVVEVDRVRYEALVEALAARGFRAATAVGRGDDVPDLILFRDPTGRRIDLLFAHTAFESEALERAHVIEATHDVLAPVVTPEDLIVYKVLADRPQDRVDILDVVRGVERRGGRIEWEYGRRWCEAWEVSARLARLREELGAA